MAIEGRIDQEHDQEHLSGPSPRGHGHRKVFSTMITCVALFGCGAGPSAAGVAQTKNAIGDTDHNAGPSGALNSNNAPQRVPADVIREFRRALASAPAPSLADYTRPSATDYIECYRFHAGVVTSITSFREVDEGFAPPDLMALLPPTTRIVRQGIRLEIDPTDRSQSDFIDVIVEITAMEGTVVDGEFVVSAPKPDAQSLLRSYGFTGVPDDLIGMGVFAINQSAFADTFLMAPGFDEPAVDAPEGLDLTLRELADLEHELVMRPVGRR